LDRVPIRLPGLIPEIELMIFSRWILSVFSISALDRYMLSYFGYALL